MYEKKNYEELDQNVRGVRGVKEKNKKNYEELDLVELDGAAAGRRPRHSHTSFRQGWKNIFIHYKPRYGWKDTTWWGPVDGTVDGMWVAWPSVEYRWPGQ